METNPHPLINASAFWAGWVENFPGWVEFCKEYLTVFYLNFLWHPSECPFRTSNTHNSYMISKFFTRPKHDFTRLGRVDGWLGRTLFKIHLFSGECSKNLVSHTGQSFWKLVYDIQRTNYNGIYFTVFLKWKCHFDVIFMTSSTGNCL